MMHLQPPLITIEADSRLLTISITNRGLLCTGTPDNDWRIDVDDDVHEVHIVGFEWDELDSYMADGSYSSIAPYIIECCPPECPPPSFDTVARVHRVAYIIIYATEVRV